MIDLDSFRLVEHPRGRDEIRGDVRRKEGRRREEGGKGGAIIEALNKCL